jgi:hypothetical protein
MFHSLGQISGGSRLRKMRIKVQNGYGRNLRCATIKHGASPLGLTHEVQHQESLIQLSLRPSWARLAKPPPHKTQQLPAWVARP